MLLPIYIELSTGWVTGFIELSTKWFMEIKNYLQSVSRIYASLPIYIELSTEWVTDLWYFPIYIELHMYSETSQNQPALGPKNMAG
jgi:hypothetical protein